MKKIMFAVALMASMAFANAQVKSAEDIQKAIDKAEAAAQNAKKAVKPETWIGIAKAYVNAYGNPTANVVGGDKTQLQLVMGNDKPLSTEMVQVGGKELEKAVYKDKNLYFDGNNLVIIEVTKPSYQGDALAKALEAYSKAASLDEKGKKTKEITEAIEALRPSGGGRRDRPAVPDRHGRCLLFRPDGRRGPELRVRQEAVRPHDGPRLHGGRRNLRQPL